MLIRYMDPHGEGQLTCTEMEEAFRRAHATPPELQEARTAGDIINMFDDMLIQRKKR